MSETIEVAKAYVTIIPSMEGSQKTITEELTGAGDTAGSKAGEAAGKSFGSSLGKGVTAAGVGLTAATTGLIGGSYAAWKEVDAAADTVAIKTGAVGDDLKDLQDIMKDIAGEIPVSFQEAGDAVGEVNTRFNLTGDELKSLSTQFVKFSKLNGTSVSGSVDKVSKAMAAFGMDAEEASGFLDDLNVVGQHTGVNVDTLAEQVARNAASFKEFGMTAGDAANFLGECDKNGLDATSAVTGLRTAMKKSAESGKSLNSSLADFGSLMKSNATEADKQAAAYELFGSKAGAAIYNAFNTGSMTMATFTQSLEDTAGSVATTFDTIVDPTDQMSTVMNDLKSVGADLFSVLGELALPILEHLRDAVKGLKEWWDGLDEGTKETIGKFVEFAAVAGPVLIVAGKLGGAFSSLLGSLTGGGNGGGLIGGIKGLVGGIKGIVEHGGAGATALKALGTVGAAAGAAVGGWFIGGKISDELYKMGVYGEDVAGVLDDWFKQDYGQRAVTLAETIGEEFNYWADDVKRYWHEVFHPEDAPKWKQEGYKDATDFYHAVLEKTGAWEEQTIDEYGNVVTVIHTKNSELKNDTVKTVNELTDATKSSFAGLPSSVADSLASTNSKLQEFESQGVTSFCDATKSSLAGVPSAVADAMAEANRNIALSMEDAADSVNGMIGQLGRLKSATKSSLAGIPSSVLDKLSWHASAAVQPEVFTKPTVIGVGDAAEPEILMGQSMLMKALQRGEGEIVLNVYPSQGMDERELAQYVMRELEFAKARRAAAIG